MEYSTAVYTKEIRRYISLTSERRTYQKNPNEDDLHWDGIIFFNRKLKQQEQRRPHLK